MSSVGYFIGSLLLFFLGIWLVKEHLKALKKDFQDKEKVKIFIIFNEFLWGPGFFYLLIIFFSILLVLKGFGIG